MINVGDKTNPAITPLQDQRKCTRQSPCKKKGWPICDIPRSETHHTQDLTEAVGNLPSTKVSRRPSTPPDHIFSILAEQLQQAIQNKEMNELEDLLEEYRLLGRTCTDYFKYDHTEILGLLKTAQKLITPFTRSSPTPTAQQPQQHHQPQPIGHRSTNLEI